MAGWSTAAIHRQVSLPPPVRTLWQEGAGDGSRGRALTSVEHGAVAELRPVPAAPQQGVIGDHGGVVAPSPAPAFGAPPPVRLKER